MEYEDIKVGKLYWLMEGEQKIVKVVVLEGFEDGTLKIRLPNGALQTVYPDELEP